MLGSILFICSILSATFVPLRETYRYFIHPGSARTPPMTARPGMNALCPCGSGRKYKHCCQVKEYAREVSDMENFQVYAPNRQIVFFGDPATEQGHLGPLWFLKVMSWIYGHAILSWVIVGGTVGFVAFILWSIGKW